MKLLMEGMDGYLNDNKTLMGEKMVEVMEMIKPKKKRTKRIKRKSKRQIPKIHKITSLGKN